MGIRKTDNVSTAMMVSGDRIPTFAGFSRKEPAVINAVLMLVQKNEDLGRRSNRKVLRRIKSSVGRFD